MGHVLWNRPFYLLFLRNLPSLQLDLIKFLVFNHNNMEFQTPLHCSIFARSARALQSVLRL